MIRLFIAGAVMLFSFSVHAEWDRFIRENELPPLICSYSISFDRSVVRVSNWYGSTVECFYIGSSPAKSGYVNHYECNDGGRANAYIKWMITMSVSYRDAYGEFAFCR